MTPDLELVDDDVRLVSLTFGISLYTDRLFSTIPEAVLACQEKFLSLCPPAKLTFYSTENMRKHQPVNKRVLNMLETWLKPGAPPRPTYVLELRDGEHQTWAPKYHFWVYGKELLPDGTQPKQANYVAMAFPHEWGLERTEEMLQFTRSLCEIFPFSTGHAGYSFVCSRYADEESQTYAWKKCMRHRGIDIFGFVIDPLAVDHDAVKGVNWLTILDDRFVKELGGEAKVRKALPKAVETLPVKNGLLLKAGDQPQIGDTNRREFLPEYKAVYKLIKPLVERAIDRWPSLNLAGEDFAEQTRSWIRRFDDA
jgi:hypothetical protein